MSDWRQNNEALEQVYRTIAGGGELLDYLGEVPSFHDGEIISLELNRNSACHLKIHTWSVKLVDRQLEWKSAKHAIVNFKLEQILDLQLDGFSIQNVIGGLMIERVLPSSERKPSLSSEDQNSEDFELTMEPCYGLDGRIRCKAISISFEKKLPSDSIYANLT